MINKRGSEWHQWDLHLHTASSYDYKYKNEDADNLLINALRKNNIKAVAITDHFKIDAARIENLKKLAPEITFFPGVELRTDKGSSNIHIILIFSEKLNLRELENSFKYIMIEVKAYSKDSDETIFWDYNDIVEFCNQHKGIISIHAGHKSNGIDSEIGNDNKFTQAIKKNYSETIDILEVNKIKDITGYKDIIFQEIKERPVIICSDNHDPKNYFLKEKLWIKSNLTFEGLLQAIKQPEERIFVGEEPPKLISITRNSHNIIDSIEVKKREDSKNAITWFNKKIELNSSLVSIIGNKGSGKSALADIIALIGENKQVKKYGSFLTKERFDRSPEYFAKDYQAKCIFKNGKSMFVETISLENKNEQEYDEKVQYLPQRYLEYICTELGESFQQEINKVIFYFLPEKNEARNLEDYVQAKSQEPLKIINNLRKELFKTNSKIIELENLKTQSYITELERRIKAVENKIEEHNTIKPLEVKEPPKITSETEKISNLNENMEILEENKASINKKIKNLIQKKEIIDDLKRELKEKNEEYTNFNYHIQALLEKFKDINISNFMIEFKVNLVEYEKLLSKIEKEIDEETVKLEKAKTDYEVLKTEKENIINSSNIETKKYQKYLNELKLWEEKKKELTCDGNNKDNLEYLNKEKNYIKRELDEEYKKNILERKNILRNIYKEKENIVNIYSNIYKEVNDTLKKILSEIDSGISFSATLNLKLEPTKLSDHINKNIKSLFLGKDNCNKKINTLIEEINIKDVDTLIKFIDNIILGCKNNEEDDWDTLKQVVKNKEEMYDFLFNLNYIEVEYMLTLNNVSLSKLSPGEKGLVLLIFYLVLDRKNTPIIIDQPEDNLDNQSIYTKLVPCILEAKKRRQVILVTHNPNIAVACDSEQIIVADIDKINNQFSYISGSIEDSEINKKIVEILEGTFPAFNLRKEKYIHIPF
ncbi:MAG: hypothetical protein SPJ84_03790 [Fusobacterium gastrosuis]|uniref:TrlF family AAA-like ATPase n=1 Tax=Fusobacterium TaxID=848 RepID=UPI0025BD316E|nr:hypothetical protein [Fusobacterium sp.]MCI7223506.1 hypothetical protein [Fusobacterium sp.]MDD7392227.1 hypothetical protein [Fusobacteriaceae bacterium]MDY5794929.1 hypothetical protein [Fusobacterium gastrosuis]